MRIGIASDSHDNVPMIEAAVAAFRKRKAELIIHAGDFVAPFAVKRFLALGVPFIAVFGNCDGEHQVVSKLLPDIVEGARRESLGGRSFIIVHSLDWLELAEQSTADVIVCGHTHEAGISGRNPIIINPGECGGWVNGRSTAAFLDTDTMTPELFELKTQ